MQNEDDLRGLAKVMDFMRAISSDKHLLVLLPVVQGMGYQYRGSR